MLNSTTESQNEELMADNVQLFEDVDPNETFDNLDYVSEKSKEYGQKFQKTKGEDKGKDEDEEEVGEELKLLNDSDGTEKKTKEVKKEAKEKEEEDEDEEKVEDKKEKEEEKEEEEKKLDEVKTDPKGKKLRIKIGDEMYSLPPDAVFKHKIDGEIKEFTLQEALNEFSGKTAWDKKFTEIGNEKKILEQEKNNVIQEKNLIVQRLQPILDTLKDPSKDPFEAIMYLVDMVGGNPYDIYRRSLDTRLDELDKLYSMSDVERKAYFLEKQNEFLLKSTEKRNSEIQRHQSFNQQKAKVDQIRQAYGVSEEQYVDAYEELSSFGYEDSKLSDEFIAEWASIKPFKAKVSEMMTKYEDEIADNEYGNVVATLSRYLRDGKITEQRLTEYLEEEFGTEKIVKELNSKINKTGPKKKVQEVEEEDRIVTFDDLID